MSRIILPAALACAACLPFLLPTPLTEAHASASASAWRGLWRRCVSGGRRIADHAECRRRAFTALNGRSPRSIPTRRMAISRSTWS